MTIGVGRNDRDKIAAVAALGAMTEWGGVIRCWIGLSSR